MEILLFIQNLLAATLRVATPLMFGTMGELFAERSGVFNLGIKGTMFRVKLWDLRLLHSPDPYGWCSGFAHRGRTCRIAYGFL